MKPDACTSLRCHKRCEYCFECSHALFYGEGKDSKGKIWMWEFNHRFGPLFLRKDGEPLINQPKSESHLAWEAFETWDLPKQIVKRRNKNARAKTGD